MPPARECWVPPGLVVSCAWGVSFECRRCERRRRARARAHMRVLVRSLTSRPGSTQTHMLKRRHKRSKKNICATARESPSLRPPCTDPGARCHLRALMSAGPSPSPVTSCPVPSMLVTAPTRPPALRSSSCQKQGMRYDHEQPQGKTRKAGVSKGGTRPQVRARNEMQPRVCGDVRLALRGRCSSKLSVVFHCYIPRYLRVR